jgi:hypothetical protein
MSQDADAHYREALHLTEVQLWVEQIELQSLSPAAAPAVRQHIESEISRLEQQAAVQRARLDTLAAQRQSMGDGGRESISRSGGESERG